MCTILLFLLLFKVFYFERLIIMTFVSCLSFLIKVLNYPAGLGQCGEADGCRPADQSVRANTGATHDASD